MTISQEKFLAAGRIAALRPTDIRKLDDGEIFRLFRDMLWVIPERAGPIRFVRCNKCQGRGGRTTQENE